ARGSRCRGYCGPHGCLGKEFANGVCVGGVGRALIDHLQHIVGSENGGSHLDPAGTPAIGHWHLSARERDLIAGYCYRFQDSTADHPLGLLVKIGEVVGWRVHSAASCKGPPSALSANSLRNLRNTPGSDWEST